MNLRFILGRAGTGKTSYILNEVVTAANLSPQGPPIILLVPEQATFQMEYSLAAAIDSRGSIRAQVLSFRRLAHRVLLETGGGARIPIGELGKRMVLRQLLDYHNDSLRVFGRSTGRMGFTDYLVRGIGELKNYLVTPEELATASTMLSGSGVLLQNKLADMAILYREMEKYLEPRYTDPDDYLKLLADKVADSPSFKDAVFWLDGFKGFTPQEILVIERIFQAAGQVNIALCLDPACLKTELYEDDLFYPTWDTHRAITQVAVKNRVNVCETVTISPEIPFRFTGCPDIAHLEKHFFNYPAPLFKGTQQNIRIVAGVNRRAEVEACAREIIGLSRDKSYRWRDIAVALRDIEPYHELLSTVFKDYDIPFFIDRKRTVMHHPLVEFIRSALEIVIKDWSYEPVFRCLKTDLVPVSRDSVFLMENYVLAHGIRGKKWYGGEDWQYRYRYTLGEDTEIDTGEQAALNEINEARKSATGELTDFFRSITTAGSVREMTAALFKLLDDLNTAAKVDQWRIEAEKALNLDKAREHAQIWVNVTELLDEVVEALGEKEISLDTYLGILDAGFESMTVGLIPPGLDQVVVGSLDRSRNPSIKALFLLGTSEGVLPARPSDDGVFNDGERERLQEVGVSLAPGSRRQAFEEQFLVYTALTRASEKLWVSYPKADVEGQAIAPSAVVTRIQELVPNVGEYCYQVEPLAGDETDDTEFLAHPGRALTYLTAKLREAKAGGTVKPIWWGVYNWFLDTGYNEKTQPIVKSVFHVNSERPISGQVSHSLYGRPVKASVSRLEKFKACPFAHFSSYGLSLKERKMFRLEAPDMGEFFHTALKNFTDELQNKSLDWGEMLPEDCIKLNETIIAELAPQLQSEILLSTARYRYLTRKLKKTVDRATIVLAEHARRSKFRPVGTEMSFGPGGQLPPLTLELMGGESLQLRGRIDRLDMAHEDGVYLRVIDYKSGDNSIKLEDIYYGLRLQLLTYLHVALTHYAVFQGVESRPGGILYFTVKEPLITGNGPMPKEEVDRAVLSQLKMRGFLLADPNVFKMMDSLVETGYSELFPIGLKKDGSFYGGSPVIDGEQFQMLRSYLEKVLIESGQEILQGNVNIEPYRNNKMTACRYCSFKPVCKFDPLLEGNSYRILPPISPDEIWHAIAGEVGNYDE
ncbi:MAG: helicase-exonuclease AddAB subunit AddB [Firmicutes bacterium]|nr:helicase-exonuclease AddAB subunit AddB [Bacillota bacterium]